jgi:hypothetical protein
MQFNLKQFIKKHNQLKKDRQRRKLARQRQQLQQPKQTPHPPHINIHQLPLFERLSDDILCECLSYLNNSSLLRNCSVLNHRFHRLICESPRMWRDRSVVLQSATMTKATFKMFRICNFNNFIVKDDWHCLITLLDKHGNYIQKLQFSSTKPPKIPARTAIVKAHTMQRQVPNLQELSLTVEDDLLASDNKIGWQGFLLKLLINATKSLKSIYVAGMIHFDEFILSGLLQQKQLRCIEFEETTIQPSYILKLFEELPIERFTCYDHCMDPIWSELTKSAKHLKTLQVWGSRFIPLSRRTTTRTIPQQSEPIYTLETLDIRETLMLTSLPNMLQSAAQTLTTLILSSQPVFIQSLEINVDLIPALVNLRYLTLHFIPMSYSIVFMERCASTLEELDLVLSIQEVAEGIGEVPHSSVDFPKLKSIEAALVPELLKFILMRCTTNELDKLSIEWVDYNELQIVNITEWTHILSHFTKIREFKGLKSLFNCLPERIMSDIQHLSIIHNDLSSIDISNKLKQCRSLKTVQVDNGSDLYEATNIYIMENNPNLTELAFSDIIPATFKSFNTSRLQITNIQSFNANLGGLTADCLYGILSSMPHLKILSTFISYSYEHVRKVISVLNELDNLQKVSITVAAGKLLDPASMIDDESELIPVFNKNKSATLELSLYELMPFEDRMLITMAFALEHRNTIISVFPEFDQDEDEHLENFLNLEYEALDLILPLLNKLEGINPVRFKSLKTRAKQQQLPHSLPSCVYQLIHANEFPEPFEYEEW